MKYIVLTIITLFLYSCTCKKHTTDNGDQNTDAVATSNESFNNVIVDKEYVLPKENGDFKVLEATIEGDILTLKVSYGGGCETHEFNAYFNEMYMKSLPPKAAIFIEHKNNNDHCKKMITEDLKFDLTNVRYPGKDKDYTIMIGVTNYEGYLEYKY